MSSSNELPNTPSIQQIVRHRFYTGEFGDCHFRVPSRDLLCNVTGTQQKAHVFDIADGVARWLIGIPVVIDSSLPKDVWRLALNSDPCQVLYEGQV